MGKNKPKWKIDSEPELEWKTLVTVNLYCKDYEEYGAEDTGKVICKHIYKTFPFDESSDYFIDGDTLIISVGFNVNTILNADYLPLEFGKMFESQMYKNLPFDLCGSEIIVYEDVAKEVGYSK